MTVSVSVSVLVTYLAYRLWQISLLSFYRLSCKWVYIVSHGHHHPTHYWCIFPVLLWLLAADALPLSWRTHTRAGCGLWCFLWIQLLHDAVFWKCTLINKLVRSHQPPRNRLILANIEGELGIAIHDRFLHCCVFLLALEKMWKRQGQGGSAQLDVPTDRQSREIAEDRVTKFWLTKARHSSTLFFW